MTTPRAPRACRILMIGDVIGKPGREAIERILPELRAAATGSTSSPPTARTWPAAWA